MDDSGKKQHGSQALAEPFRFSPRPNLAHQIDWQQWSEEAFERAEKEGKPVLLSISAVWCHWCHVMDETSYSDRAVIDLINRRFIPIRVDSDRNPDINRRYNQGGWPTTAFLDPRGMLLAGATYIPPEAMRAALERISELYGSHTIQIESPDMDSMFGTASSGDPDLRKVEETGASILRAWDHSFGGLGRQPKFPQTDALALSLELFGDEGNAEYLTFARTTLEAMIRGNLLDKVEGGFFRYSTTRDWSIPHYEKMLGDNASLISILIKAYAITGAEIFRRIAAETASYIYRTLSDGTEKFYGSQDADEEYYLLKEEGRAGREAPPVDATVYTDQAARAASVFLEAGTVLAREEYVSLALAVLEFLWSESFRPGDGLAHYHDGNPHRWGLVDDGVEAAAAYIKAYAFTGSMTWLERADSLLRLISEGHWDGRKGMLLDTTPAHSLSGLKPQMADLASQARAAESMLYLWAVSGEEEWRHNAGLILSASMGMMDAYGIMAAPAASAVNLLLRGPLMVNIEGDVQKEARPFMQTALLSPRPRILPIIRVEVGRIESEPRAEVCTTQACQLQTSELEVLAEHLGLREEITKAVIKSERGLSG